MIFRSRSINVSAISFVLSLCAIFLFAETAMAQTITKAELLANAAKMKEKIVKIGQGNDATLVRRDGKEYYGTLSSIEDEVVLIRDVDLKDTIELNYQEITKVSKGYGERRAWNGKRIPPNKRRIGLIIAAAAIAVPVAIVLASMSKQE